jgi:hypothetical protein
MQAANLSAKQISARLHQVMGKLGTRCTEEDWAAVGEAIHRVQQHEALQEVVRDLRMQLGEKQFKPDSPR